MSGGGGGVSHPYKKSFRFVRAYGRPRVKIGRQSLLTENITFASTTCARRRAHWRAAARPWLSPGLGVCVPQWKTWKNVLVEKPWKKRKPDACGWMRFSFLNSFLYAYNYQFNDVLFSSLFFLQLPGGKRFPRWYENTQFVHSGADSIGIKFAKKS